MNRPQDRMLTAYRRHEKGCPHAAKGRAWTKCGCPIHCDGIVRGRRVRRSLDTRNWARAMRRLAELEEARGEGRKPKTVGEAAEAFLSDRSHLEPATLTKYRRILGRLEAFARAEKLATVAAVALEDLDRYRQGRKLSALTWSKELQLLRTFFAFCQKRKWIEENPAKEMRMPRSPKPKPRAPYTEEEITRILAACDSFGRHAYERLRARAIVLLLRRYGLRISDAATLERARVRDGEIFVHAMKNGAELWLPLEPDVAEALERVPPPDGGEPGRYYFWTGAGSRHGHIKTVERTLQAVFRESRVAGAQAHRFRHTLATEILLAGGSIEDAANLLGDTPEMIRKHYWKWSQAYRERTVELFGRLRARRQGGADWHASGTRGFPGAEVVENTGGNLVLEEGVEQTRPKPNSLIRRKLFNFRPGKNPQEPQEPLFPQKSGTPVAHKQNHSKMSDRKQRRRN